MQKKNAKKEVVKTHRNRTDLIGENFISYFQNNFFFFFFNPNQGPIFKMLLCLNSYCKGAVTILCHQPGGGGRRGFSGPPPLSGMLPLRLPFKTIGDSQFGQGWTIHLEKKKVKNYIKISILSLQWKLYKVNFSRHFSELSILSSTVINMLPFNLVKL